MQNLEQPDDRFPEDGSETEIMFASGPGGVWYAYGGYGPIRASILLRGIAAADQRDGALMGDVIKLSFGRVKKGEALPKPVECRECEEPIETARLQWLEANQIIKPWRCISCAKLWDKRFENQMRGVQENQAVEVLR